MEKRAPLSEYYGDDLRGRSGDARGFSQWEISRLEPIEGQWPGEISTHSATGPLTGQCVVALHTAGINIEVLVRQDSWYFRQCDRPPLPSSLSLIFFLPLGLLRAVGMTREVPPLQTASGYEMKKERGKDPGLGPRACTQILPCRMPIKLRALHTRCTPHTCARISRRVTGPGSRSWWFVTRRPGESATLTGLYFNTHEAHCCNLNELYGNPVKKEIILVSFLILQPDDLVNRHWATSRA